MTSDEDYRLLYNCSFYAGERVNVVQRSHYALGVLFLVSGAVAELLYVPCMWALSRPERVRKSCYKFMLLLGTLDMLNILFCGFLTGYFAVAGVVFCSHPSFIYWAGKFGLGAWIAESMTAVILALNRCVQIYDPLLAERLFDGRKAYRWMALPVSYALAFFILSPPPVYSGLYVGCATMKCSILALKSSGTELLAFTMILHILFRFFNPHLGYTEDGSKQYNSLMHSVHNAMLGPLLIIIYMTLFFQQYYKWSKRRHGTTDTNFFSLRTMTALSQQKSVNTFLQVSVISLMHMMASLAYIYMQFYPNAYVAFFASYGWLWIQGITPVIYLTLNVSIRSAILGAIGCRKSTNPHVILG